MSSTGGAQIVQSLGGDMLAGRIAISRVAPRESDRVPSGLTKMTDESDPGSNWSP
jgi:hypothetical protein